MKTASDPRHLSRQKIVQELFAYQAQADSHGPEEGKTSKIALSSQTKEVIAHLPEIDQIITECAPEWEINKLNQIDLAILRLAIFELVCESSQPAKVVMDEAVELAKEFGNENSPAFVNGALGKAFYLPLRVKKIVATKLGIDENKLTDETNLLTETNATDLEVSDLFAYLEKDYNFTFDGKVLPQTLGDLQQVIIEQNE